jgi:hypothetical protein
MEHPVEYSERTREEGRALVRAILDLDAGDLDALLVRARSLLGKERTRRYLEWRECSEELRHTHAHRTYASLAVLVAATEQLGERWWTDGADVLLAEGKLTQLQLLAESASADALWGKPVAEVDLNSMVCADRFTLPPGATAGDRFVLSFDPGSRVDAVVVARTDGRLGSELDLDSVRHAPAAEVSWAWAVCNHGLK